ncbi:transcriptional regulator [Lysobacter enzymogenes]|uniref:transcriptional regulator n=1 Tax=Lysobacter enzymogenes TaxID=69 RepID=UPI0008984E83|nr:Cro/CI family transcriptional regulator [Lysobacter enzymogenes]SDW94037.1 Putative antitoxin of toxin-antitoxin system, YdaS/YdaT [Lysobacter enzymogenes]
MNAITHAVQKIEGGQAALARELNISPQAVSQWVKGHRPVPARLALRIEELTGITRFELRPDVFGPTPTVSHASSAEAAA